MSKSMTPDDLENKVAMPQNLVSYKYCPLYGPITVFKPRPNGLYVIDIAPKLQFYEFDKPRPDGFPGILSASYNFKDNDPW